MKLHLNVLTANRVGLALLSFCLATDPVVLAKEKAAKAEEQSAVVVKHLSLSGPAVNQMFLQEEGNKQYLYIQQTSREGFIVVDVTRPDRAKVINHIAPPTQTAGGRMQMVGSGLALEETPDSSAAGGVRHELSPAKPQGTATGSLPTKSVRVLDLSDPANPRTLQTFQGVTSVLADDGRRLIYIANSEGLWILKHKQQRPPKPACDSESVFSPIANCQ
jgi:hypothetical protein